MGTCGLAVMIGAAGAAVTCHAAAGDVVNFKLLRGDTPGTIEEFQRQSHVVISFNPDVHVTTNAVDGRHSIAVAVRKFLRGTGLKAVFLPTGELAIELVVRSGRVQPQGVGPPRAAAELHADPYGRVVSVGFTWAPASPSLQRHNE